jgi:hypothetical protein
VFRVSLRELFVLVAAISLAIVSLKYASPIWQGIVGLIAMFTAIVVVMIGVFDRGPRQAFAIGFAIVIFSYALLVVNGQKIDNLEPSPNVELNTYRGHLPTSLILDCLYKALEHSTYLDASTGKIIPELGPATVHINSFGQATAAGRAVISQELPPSGNFMPVGHIWWALLLGYIGARFARFVYVRRTVQPAAANKSAA